MTSVHDERFLRLALETKALTEEQAEACLDSSQMDATVVSPALADSDLTWPALAVTAVGKGFLSREKAEEVIRRLPAADLPRKLGRYVLVERLGEGGMGSVCRAWDPRLDQPRAVKILSPALSQNRAFAGRFEDEARLAARFESENVVHILDVGEEGSLKYIVMEFVKGKTLLDVLYAEGRLDERRAFRYCADAGRGLLEAEKHNIVHRDIKPSNIMLREDDKVKLADLGIAKHVGVAKGGVRDREYRTEGVIGTPEYMSPEQAQGEDLDSRSDVYSLGATLYHLVCGEAPFVDTNAQRIMIRVALGPGPNPLDARPDLSQGAAAAICKMMARDRSQRYATVREMISDLDLVAQGFAPSVTYEEASALTGGEARSAGRAPTAVHPDASGSRTPRSASAVAASHAATVRTPPQATTPVPAQAQVQSAGQAAPDMSPRHPTAAAPQVAPRSRAAKLLWILAAGLMLGGGGALAYVGIYEGKFQDAKAWSLAAVSGLKTADEFGRWGVEAETPAPTPPAAPQPQPDAKVVPPTTPATAPAAVAPAATTPVVPPAGPAAAAPAAAAPVVPTSPAITAPAVPASPAAPAATAVAVAPTPAPATGPAAAAPPAAAATPPRAPAVAAVPAPTPVIGPPPATAAPPAATTLPAAAAVVPPSPPAVALPAWAKVSPEQVTAAARAGLPPAVEIALSGGVALRMVYVPAGKFRMGSPPDEPNRGPDETQHEVTLTRPFYMAIHEVTQQQWEAVKGSPMRWIERSPQRPADMVSWEDCQGFAADLNKLGKGLFRLPTEAEWEYACRAGSSAAYCFGSGISQVESFAWCKHNAREALQPAATSQPNAWGLYDMHGNAAEWCWDVYTRDFAPTPVVDPQGPEKGMDRVVRGGSVKDEHSACRSARRKAYISIVPPLNVGFRVVMVPPGKAK